MKIFPFTVLILLHVSFLPFCQGTQQEDDIREILNAVRSLETNVVGIQENLSILEGQMSELQKHHQGPSKEEDLLDVFIRMFEGGMTLQMLLMNNTCSREQVTNLQEYLSKELNNVRETTSNQLSIVKHGILVALQCPYPGVETKTFGCVIPVRDEPRNWDEAQIQCKGMAGRLLEGVTSVQHLDELKGHFEHIFRRIGPSGSIEVYSSWIGLRGNKWAVGGGHFNADALPIEHEIVPPGEADLCTLVCLGCSELNMSFAQCHYPGSYLCQIEIEN